MKFKSLTKVLVLVIVLMFFIVPSKTYSQYKEIPKDTKVKLKSGRGLILGFINPKNFSIDHSVNLQYATFGNASMSLASYTATLNYKVLQNLRISADVTMQYSPYATLGMNSYALDKDFQNSLNGINLSRVSLEYKPTDNMYISIDYVNHNNLYYYDNYYNRFWDYSR